MDEGAQNSEPQPDRWTKDASIVQSAILVSILLLVFVVIFIGLYQSEGRFLLQLQDINVARGLITFLVAITTVAIALILAIYVMASSEQTESLKQRFTFAKDVLSTLVGILGTVLGFYFGSSVVSDNLGMAEIQLRNEQLVTHVFGGAPPYQVVVRRAADDPAKVVPMISKDGWIFAAPPKLLDTKKGDTVIIEVTDSKNRKISKSFNYPAEERTVSGTSGAGGDQGTTPRETHVQSAPGGSGKPAPIPPK